MFKIGDKVIIIKHYKRPERLGTITTVIDFGVYHIYPGGMWYGCSDVKPGDLCIFLDLEPYGKVGYPPHYLELYKDDGNLKGEWTPELIKLCSPKKIIQSV